MTFHVSPFRNDSIISNDNVMNTKVYKLIG